MNKTTRQTEALVRYLGTDGKTWGPQKKVPVVKFADVFGKTKHEDKGAEYPGGKGSPVVEVTIEPNQHVALELLAPAYMPGASVNTLKMTAHEKDTGDLVASLSYEEGDFEVTALKTQPARADEPLLETRLMGGAQSSVGIVDLRPGRYFFNFKHNDKDARPYALSFNRGS